MSCVSITKHTRQVRHYKTNDKELATRTCYSSKSRARARNFAFDPVPSINGHVARHDARMEMIVCVYILTRAHANAAEFACSSANKKAPLGTRTHTQTIRAPRSACAAVRVFVFICFVSWRSQSCHPTSVRIRVQYSQADHLLRGARSSVLV